MTTQPAITAKSASTLDTPQEAFELARELFQTIEAGARCGVPAHEMEQQIWDFALRLGRWAMQTFFTLLGNGDQGETVTLDDGRTLKRLDLEHRRLYLSIFGLFRLSRAVYGTRRGQKIELAPLDSRLALPESQFSYLLQDWDQMQGVQQPFGRVSDLFERLLGLKQHVDSLQRMNRQMAEQADGFVSDLAPPPAEEEGEILVQTADGKGVPIRRPADINPYVSRSAHASAGRSLAGPVACGPVACGPVAWGARRLRSGL